MGDLEKGLAPAGFAAFSGANMEERIQAAAASSAVVIFGKKFCPFCIEARRTFDQLGVPHLDFDIDVLPEGNEIWDTLKKVHAPQKTVPYVYVNKVMVGGCDATKKLHFDGELNKMLAAAGVRVTLASGTSMAARVAQCGQKEGSKRAGGTLFHFPEAVDNRMVRLSGFMSFVICLLCAIYYKDLAPHWVMGGLMTDYVLRLLGGGNFSALGSLSAAVVALMEVFGSKPKFVAGPPKQFATLCGAMFSGLAFFFFLMEVHELKLRNVGIAFTCALGAANALECFIDFCLGCFFFQLMIKFKMVSPDVYTTYTNARAEIEYTWEDMNKRLKEGVAPNGVKHFVDETPLLVDFKYKAKTEDMTKEDFHPIKHVKLTHFIMHLGIVGLACAWKAADPARAGLDAPVAVWNAIGILAAILYFLWVALYALKIVMYPRKVAKELMHNVNGSCIVLPFIILVLFAYLEKDRDFEFAKVLFWIGAPTSLGLSFIKVGDWIANKKEMEHINASWMIVPVGNFVAAAVGPMLDSAYSDAMQLWFALAFVMWMVLFVITFYRAVIMPEYDDRMRPLLATWVAAPAIGAVAYVSCYAPSMLAIAGATGAIGHGYNDFIFINLHWIAIALTFILFWCFYRPYFGRIRFDMSYWGAGFPAAALAMCAIQYYAMKPGDFSEAIAYTTLAIASWLNAALFFQTIAALLRLRVFTPDQKWGPLSFMRLTHEAIRGLAARLQDQARGAAHDDLSFEAFRSTWEDLVVLFEEHGRHEDEVIFPHYNELFPGVTAPADEQHHQLHGKLESINRIISSALAAKKNEPGSAPAGLDKLAGEAEAFCKFAEEHLRTEEDHMQGLPRKYITLEVAKQIVRKCWASTQPATWFTLLPIMVNSMPMLHQRVRFLKTLLWSMPERAQHIGLILSTGVDAVQWRRITEELPEIIPRGAIGWERYY